MEINYSEKKIVLSTTKSEYSSILECTKQAIPIKRLVNEIFNKNIKINIRIDNKFLLSQ